MGRRARVRACACGAQDGVCVGAVVPGGAGAGGRAGPGGLGAQEACCGLSRTSSLTQSWCRAGARMGLSAMLTGAVHMNIASSACHQRARRVQTPADCKRQRCARAQARLCTSAPWVHDGSRSAGEAERRGSALFASVILRTRARAPPPRPAARTRSSSYSGALSDRQSPSLSREALQLPRAIFFPREGRGQQHHWQQRRCPGALRAPCARVF